MYQNSLNTYIFSEYQIKYKCNDSIFMDGEIKKNNYSEKGLS